VPVRLPYASPFRKMPLPLPSVLPEPMKPNEKNDPVAKKSCAACLGDMLQIETAGRTEAEGLRAKARCSSGYCQRSGDYTDSAKLGGVPVENNQGRTARIGGAPNAAVDSRGEPGTVPDRRTSMAAQETTRA